MRTASTAAPKASTPLQVRAADWVRLGWTWGARWLPEARPTAWPARLLTCNYFTGVNIWQVWILDQGDYLTRIHIFQGWIFDKYEYLTGKSIWQGRIFNRGEWIEYCLVFSLAHLSNNNSKVANGVLDCLLQLAQVSTSILDARKGHKQTKDVIGALEDPEDPQVPHHLLQA